MRSIGFLAISLAPVALAQSVNISSLAEALGGLGLTSLAGAAANLNQTDVGRGLLQSLLSGGNFAVFAPTNDAFSKAPSSVTSDNNLLANILAYHVLPGNFSTSNSSNPTLTSQTSPNHTIGRTSLNDSSLVQLAGNKSQVVAWAKDAGGTVSFLNQATNVSVINATRVTTIDIFVINGILSPPESMSVVLSNTSLNTSSLAGLLNNTMFPSANGTNETLSAIIDSQQGITVFAPNDAAFSAVSSSLPALQGNETMFMTVLQNHIINGTAVYSSQISNGSNMTSAAGESLTFSTNSSGTYVTSGSTTAKILRTDVLAENGVAHVIDRLLLNTVSNPSAASSAFQSATSVAAQSTTETGAITPTATGPGGSSSSGSSGSGSNGAASLLSSTQSLFSSFVVVIGCMIFGAYLV